MSTAQSLPEGVSRYRALVAFVAVSLLAGLLWYAGKTVTIPLAVFFVLAATFFVANVFDAVRDHPLYNLGRTLWTTGLFAIWYLVVSSTLVAIVTGIAALATLVELYNYWRGTAYLRIER